MQIADEGKVGDVQRSKSADTRRKTLQNVSLKHDMNVTSLNKIALNEMKKSASALEEETITTWIPPSPLTSKEKGDGKSSKGKSKGGA